MKAFYFYSSVYFRAFGNDHLYAFIRFFIYLFQSEHECFLTRGPIGRIAHLRNTGFIWVFKGYHAIWPLSRLTKN